MATVVAPAVPVVIVKVAYRVDAVHLLVNDGLEVVDARFLANILCTAALVHLIPLMVQVGVRRRSTSLEVEHRWGGCWQVVSRLRTLHADVQTAA